MRTLVKILLVMAIIFGCMVLFLFGMMLYGMWMSMPTPPPTSSLNSFLLLA